MEGKTYRGSPTRAGWEIKSERGDLGREGPRFNFRRVGIKWRKGAPRSSCLSPGENGGGSRG